MTEVQAKKHLRQIPCSLTPGSVLHLLSDLLTVSAKRARRKGDQKTEKQA
jgi:hypothetical protein